MNARRVRLLKEGKDVPGPIVYWMSRDQRVNDNWAMLFAQHKAIIKRQPLLVVFCLVPRFLDATIRQYGFMLKGIEGVAGLLEDKNISFFLLSGDPWNELPVFLRKHRAGMLITDFDPLRIKMEWKKKVASMIDIPFYEVDAHNIVPCWIASAKQEYAAYTIRPKLRQHLAEFQTDFPKIRKHLFQYKGDKELLDWPSVRRGLKVDSSVPEVHWLLPGENAARKMMKAFIAKGLARYPEMRNDPNKNAQSGLSPYLHFGQLSAQRLALEVLGSDQPKDAKDAFLEELIIRRELSDNFCFSNQNYDNSEGFPAWAKKTLNEHKGDMREYRYTLEQFEKAGTHDDLWNAAQTEMVKQGKMHGYMRMYWAKKILEWSGSVAQAMEIAIYLNDKYELEGKDPNGYAGIAWSIGGVHDRAWNERRIFGTIRYMSYNGCRSKFDVHAYIKRCLVQAPSVRITVASMNNISHMVSEHQFERMGIQVMLALKIRFVFS
jgi:deoxyribodipyrimidine photo-lyase